MGLGKGKRAPVRTGFESAAEGRNMGLEYGARKGKGAPFRAGVESAAEGRSTGLEYGAGKGNARSLPHRIRIRCGKEEYGAGVRGWERESALPPAPDSNPLRKGGVRGWSTGLGKGKRAPFRTGFESVAERMSTGLEYGAGVRG